MPTYPQPVLMDNFPEDSAACLRNLWSKPFSRISVWNSIAERSPQMEKLITYASQPVVRSLVGWLYLLAKVNLRCELHCHAAIEPGPIRLLLFGSHRLKL